MPGVGEFPSMKAGALMSVLTRKPLMYRVSRQTGSHRTLRSDFYPQLLFSYHDGVTLPPGAVRKILVKDVGLDTEAALRLLQ
jgi:predicted RNA binding protein YcfA (HicA-like mRNA interferase family)